MLYVCLNSPKVHLEARALLSQEHPPRCLHPLFPITTDEHGLRLLAEVQYLPVRASHPLDHEV